jgi:hypothetical protein
MALVETASAIGACLTVVRVPALRSTAVCGLYMYPNVYLAVWTFLMGSGGGVWTTLGHLWPYMAHSAVTGSSRRHGRRQGATGLLSALAVACKCT